MNKLPSMDPVGLIRKIPLKPHQMTDKITPLENLFMLAHVGVPHVDTGSWHLEVSGLVDNRLLLNLQMLKALPFRRIESFHQCAGDPLFPKKPKRRIANVIWGGVPLSEIIKLAEPRVEARYLWSFGLDYGYFEGQKIDAYGKYLDLLTLDAAEPLIAYEVNGEPLPVEHGAPARLVVPGYYGTNSVKWLSSLQFKDKPYEGLFSTKYYVDRPTEIERRHGGLDRPVWKVAPESIIVTPSPQQHCSNTIMIEGWAWSHGGVRAVDISDNGGASWRSANLASASENSWQRFQQNWTFTGLGKHTLMCKATSVSGETQPEKEFRNAVHSVDVEVSVR